MSSKKKRVNYMPITRLCKALKAYKARFTQTRLTQRIHSFECGSTVVPKIGFAFIFIAPLNTL